MTYSNFINDEFIRRFGESIRENSQLFHIDEYGNLFMHSILPFDEHGNVSIGRINANGKLETHEPDGERIVGFYYRDVHYMGPTVLDGLAAMERGMKSTDRAESAEARRLYNEIFSDANTQVKPKHIAVSLLAAGRAATTEMGMVPAEKTNEELFVIGAKQVAKKLGVNAIIFGHNPRKSVGDMFPMEIVDENGAVIWLDIDGGMSAYGGTGEYLVYSGVGEQGAKIYAYSGLNTDIAETRHFTTGEFFVDCAETNPAKAA